MKGLILFSIFILIIPGMIISQTTVTGSVYDEANMGLPGATILVKGTSNGTTTNLNGNYTISVPSDGVLIFSFVGYDNQEIEVSGRTVIDVLMKENVTALDEVVVIGYGSQKKVNLTGAVETVTFKGAVNQPVSNSAQLLYGRFSGVQLTQSSGNPGADGSSIVIRGIGTFGSSTPLVVIDNIQYDNLSAFNNLAPSDIESISVLKDASASAIYGARGANGVIVITTKKGDSDKFEISYNSYLGSQEATVIPEFLNSFDYATLINEKFRNEDGPGYTPRYSVEQLDAIRTGSLPDQFTDTKWTDEVLIAAPIQNHHLSFSGGNEKTTYRLSLGFKDQDAIVRSKFNSKRYNLGIKLNSDLSDWFNITSVTNAFWSRNIGPSGGQNAFSGDHGIIYSFQRSAPTIPAYYSNGEYGVVDGAYEGTNFSFQTKNPIRVGYLGNYESDQINISQRLGLTFTLSENLSFETSGSANIINSNTSNFSPTQLQNDWEDNPVILVTSNNLSNSTNLSYRLLGENILRYNQVLYGDHHFGALLGHSAIYYKTDGFSGSLGGFPTDNLEEFNAGGVVDPAVTGGAQEEAYQSFFGRVNYNYAGKYLVEFNLRRDGSGKFGKGNRYGNFPSASVGWRVSEEPFFQSLGLIDNLKIRGSWGISGNDRIGNYIFEQTYNPGIDYVLGTDNTVVGVGITNLANPNIKWEETEQYDIGLDVALFQYKIAVSADYFKRNSKDILYNNFPVPSTIGVSSLGSQNAASMINEGLEVSLSYRDNIKDLSFVVGANMTKFFNNEVTGLGEGGEETISGTTIIRIGAPFKAYYGYRPSVCFKI